MADSKKRTRKKSTGSTPGRKKSTGSTPGRKKTAAKRAGSKTASKKMAAASADNSSHPTADERQQAAPDQSTADSPAAAARQAEAPITRDTTATTAPAHTVSRAVAWISLLLAIAACTGVGLLLLNKGVAYFSTPADNEPSATAQIDAVMREHPRLASLEHSQSEQQQQIQQLRSSLDGLQQDISAQGAQQQRLAQLETALQDLSSNAAVSNQELTSSLNTLQGQQQNQARRMHELEATLAQLRARQNDNEAELQRQFVLLQLRQRLDEISALLRTGRQQLLLNGNQQAALAAYDLAVRALQELPVDDGVIPATQINELQQALINERSQLASVNIPDMDSMLAELHGLADAAQNWPLQNDNNTGAADAGNTGAAATDSDSAANDDSDNGGLWQKLRANLGHLVTVRNTDQPQLSIDEQLRLKRHLQLQLRTAALLALQQREHAWRSSLDSIDDFIQQWFASDNRGVAAARQRLRELAQIELQADWPQPEQARQLLADMQASASLQSR